MKIFFKKKCGFTLIEVIISMAIFVIILGLVTVNHRQGENFNTFRLEAFNIEDSIRSVQNMAMTGKEIAGEIPDAYGIFFNEAGDNVIVYGDLNGNNLFDEEIDLIYSSSFLSGGVSFNRYNLFCDGFVSSANLHLAFIPPQPTMIINNVSTCSSSIIIMESDHVGGEWGVYFDAVTGRTWTEFSQ